MRKNKKVVILLTVSILLLSLHGCRLKPSIETQANKPCVQLKTYWVSKDYRMLFYVESESLCSGKMLDETGCLYDVMFCFDFGHGVDIYPLSMCETNTIQHSLCMVEMIATDYYPDHFSVTVKDTNYYQNGDEFTFQKVSKQEYENALEYYQKALSIWDTLYEPEHQDIIITKEKIAKTQAKIKEQ